MSYCDKNNLHRARLIKGASVYILSVPNQNILILFRTEFHSVYVRVCVSLTHCAYIYSCNVRIILEHIYVESAPREPSHRDPRCETNKWRAAWMNMKGAGQWSGEKGTSPETWSFNKHGGFKQCQGIERNLPTTTTSQLHSRNGCASEREREKGSRREQRAAFASTRMIWLR